MTNLFTNYISAEIKHAVKGEVLDQDAQDRLAICMTCNFRAVEYKGVKDAKGIGFCAGGCGCGATGRSKLDVKVTIEGATCPKNKWKTNPKTKGASVKSVWQASKGVVSTALYFVGDKLKKSANNENPQALSKDLQERILKDNTAMLVEINRVRNKHGFPDIKIEDLQVKITHGTSQNATTTKD